MGGYGRIWGDTGRRRLQAEADGERWGEMGRDGQIPGDVVFKLKPMGRDCRDVAEMWPRYSPDTAQIQPRCGPDVAQMWPRCGRGCGGAPCSFLRAVAPSCRISGSPPPLQVAHKFFKRSRETLSMKMAIPLRAALLGFETSRGPERTREDPRGPESRRCLASRPPSRTSTATRSPPRGAASRGCEQRLFTPLAVNRSPSRGAA